MIINDDFFSDGEIVAFVYAGKEKSTLVLKGGTQWNIPTTENRSQEISLELEKRSKQRITSKEES